MSKKKKILWIGDDIRMQSGVATAGRQMIFETVHKYDYAVIAGAIKHPEKGKVFDLSESTNKLCNIKDAYVKLYAVDDYGNENILFQIISMEQPNAICFITDPRFWPWLFSLEKQVRQAGIPLCYWALWDGTPYPRYNHAFYRSVDCMMAISKQSNNIHKWVLGPENCTTIDGLFDNNGNVVKY